MEPVFPEGSFPGYVEALKKVSAAIASDLYLEDILKLIVTVTAEVMQSKIMSLMLLDEKGLQLIIRATQSVSEDYNKKPPLRVGEGIAGKVVATNKPIAVDDVRKEVEYKYKNIAEREALCSLLCVPLSVKGRAIGVINSYTSVPHHFTRTEIDMLTSVAHQAAISIENTELLVQTKVIQEELQARKMIERAKDILVKRLDISGEEAYKRIQKRSMNIRRPMKEIAEAIVLASEIEK